jgi:hypothetical protein
LILSSPSRREAINRKGATLRYALVWRPPLRQKLISGALFPKAERAHDIMTSTPMSSPSFCSTEMLIEIEIGHLKREPQTFEHPDDPQNRAARLKI